MDAYTRATRFKICTQNICVCRKHPHIRVRIPSCPLSAATETAYTKTRMQGDVHVMFEGDSQTLIAAKTLHRRFYGGSKILGQFWGWDLTLIRIRSTRNIRTCLCCKHGVFVRHSQSNSIWTSMLPRHHINQSEPSQSLRTHPMSPWPQTKPLHTYNICTRSP